MCACNKSINGMKKRKSTRRRARVRGLNKGDAIGQLEQVALVAAGAIGSAYLKEKVSYLADPEHKTIAGGVLLAGGVLGGIGLKNPLARSVCMGVAINGLVTLANSFMPGDKALPAIGGVGGGIGLYPNAPHRYGIADSLARGQRKVRLG